MSRPTEIAEIVVRRVSVRKMASLHSTRARPGKRFKDKAMNKAVMDARVKRDAKMPPLVYPLGSKTIPVVADDVAKAPSVAVANGSPQRPHAAVVSNAVAGEAFDVAVLDGRLDLRHDRRPFR